MTIKTLLPALVLFCFANHTPADAARAKRISRASQSWGHQRGAGGRTQFVAPKDIANKGTGRLKAAEIQPLDNVILISNSRDPRVAANVTALDILGVAAAR